MSAFLGALASQLGAGENTTNSLNTESLTGTTRYGLLGDFANKIDQSAERKYLEEGYLRKDAFNADSKQFELIMQEPNATIFIKKRMFSSLADNHKTEYMDAQERLYYKATTVLFQNKCAQISALEKLSKIQKVVSSMDKVDDQIMSLIFTLGSSFNFTSQNPDFSQFNSTLDRLRRVYAYNSPATTTSWITDSTNLFRSTFGQGTGVIELTNFTNFSTTTTTDLSGNFSISIADPYESMVITEYDIENAISSAGNSVYNNGFFQGARKENEVLISDLTTKLNSARKRRGASNITINVNPDTLLGKKVTAIIDGIGLEIPFEYNVFSKSALLGGLDTTTKEVVNPTTKEIQEQEVGGNSGVTVPKEYLFDGYMAGFQGLTSKPFQYKGLDESLGGDPDKTYEAKFYPQSELSIFQSLIATIYNQLTLDANSKNVFYQSGKAANYARRKLRFNFLGKLMIQPMDTVHIYLNSKTLYDNRLLSGLKNMFSGLNFMQKANIAATGAVNSFNAVFNSEQLNNYAEKAVFVGPEFPNFLWLMLRPQFVNEKEGTHIFAGIVDSAEGTWSGDKFNVSVRGSDNSSYLTMGKVNFKPGVDDWAGKIYDPLTPFKTSFDEVSSNYKQESPELLDENKILLGESKRQLDKNEPPLVRFKAGAYMGSPVNGTNYIQDRRVDPKNNQITRTFFAPDGLVYKWKEGIGSFVQFGSSLDLNDPTTVGVASISQEPFAGQDVMNVISLLVTGHPYNFATYWQAVANFESIKNNPNQNAAQSFYTAISGKLEKRNALWGNFIPFKNLVMDEASFAQAQTSLFTILGASTQLQSDLQKLQDLENDARTFDLHFIINKEDVDRNSKSAGDAEKIKERSLPLQASITKQLENIGEEYKSYFSQVGDDISFDFNDFMPQGKDYSILADPKSRRELRRKVNFLTRRMSYSVRANEDKNLFIVDDFYDKDYDIAAFNSALSNGFQLYNTEFWDIKQKIKAVAQLLNLEVFCDTQGHIRVRPPQYNKMPSSVFYKMMYQNRTLKVKIFPEFLSNLFDSQLNTLREKLEILEDEIRVYGAILGFTTDQEVENFIANPSLQDATNVAPLNNKGSPFKFISSETAGLITDIASLKKQAMPVSEDVSLKEFETIKTQACDTKNIFTSSQKYAFLKERVTDKQKELEEMYGENATITAYIDNLIFRIEQKSGQKVQKSVYYKKLSYLDPNDLIDENIFQYVDIFKVSNDLSKKLSERQKSVKLFYETLKNSAEFSSLDDDNSAANKLLSSGQFNNSKIPEIFEHMIEDETYDDYGPHSGQRYIIKNSQIKNYTIRENPPELTYVEVRGTLNPYNTQLPQELNSFPNRGNGLVTGAAVDYDLWRNYGWREANSSVEVPFFNDPKSQCAPYAVSILSRARKNILGGSVTIVGNEYMQPGEVVYLENRGLLFYVTSVSHNFTFGGSFTTTLSLSYGHAPGEYIPTALDVIGKMLYNNRDTGLIDVKRNTSSVPGASLGAMILDPKLSATVGVLNKKPEDAMGGNYGSDNLKILNNLSYTAAFYLYNNVKAGTNLNSKIELRIYTDKDKPDAKLKEFANLIRDMLINVKFPSEDQDMTSKNSALNLYTFKEEDVEVKVIKLLKENEFRSPSDKAWAAVRGLLDKHSPQVATSTLAKANVNEGDTESLTKAISKTERKKITAILTQYIVDCWVVSVTKQQQKLAIENADEDNEEI